MKKRVVRLSAILLIVVFISSAAVGCASSSRSRAASERGESEESALVLSDSEEDSEEISEEYIEVEPVIHLAMFERGYSSVFSLSETAQNDDCSMKYVYQYADEADVTAVLADFTESVTTWYPDFTISHEDTYESGDTVYHRYWFDYSGSETVRSIYEDTDAGESVLLALAAEDGTSMSLYSSLDIAFDDEDEAEDEADVADASSVDPGSAGTGIVDSRDSSSSNSVVTTASDTGAVLPDLGVFLNCGRGEDMEYQEDGHLLSYSFDLDNGKDAVNEVIELLQDSRYELTLIDEREADYTSSSAMLFTTWEFSYTGSDDDVTALTDDEYSFDVRVLTGYYYSEGRIGMTIYYSNGFTLVEPDERVVSQPVDYSASGSSSSSSSSSSSGSNVAEFAKTDCSICDGDGKCTVCGGDGYLWSSASGKEDRNCWRCNHTGDCWACGGSGKQ